MGGHSEQCNVFCDKVIGLTMIMTMALCIADILVKGPQLNVASAENNAVLVLSSEGTENDVTELATFVNEHLIGISNAMQTDNTFG